MPATPPTEVIPLTPAQQPPKHAQITYTNDILTVSAENSSLNQILRQISRETGLKITGGVSDERVFGKYGPAPSAQILAQLLDGTSSNMLIVNGRGNTPAELILTPRLGGPTPPNPNAAAAASDDDRSEPAREPEPPPSNISSFPPPPPTIPPSTPAETSPTDASQPDSPNGVKTPQQIYDQLQRLRQQQPLPPQQ
jgi:hypothetical protein